MTLKHFRFSTILVFPIFFLNGADIAKEKSSNSKNPQIPRGFELHELNCKMFCENIFLKRSVLEI